MMPRTLSRTVSIALSYGLAWLVLGLPQARAGFTVTLDGTTASGTNTQFNYSASIGTGDSIVAGNTFTIYDFSGLVPGSLKAPDGWSGSTATTTPPPNVLLTHGDDPAVPNLTFTYNGSSTISGPASVTGFSALSVFSDAKTTKDFVGVIGRPGVNLVSSVGDVQTPGDGLPSPAPAPEPSSLISGGIGLLLAGLAVARRRRAA
jgi:MYXO-CTERM domain-containing protein